MTRRLSLVCSRCRGPNDVPSGRYCRACKAAYMRDWRAAGREADNDRQMCPTTNRPMLTRKVSHMLARDLDDVRSDWCKSCCAYHVIPKGPR